MEEKHPHKMVDKKHFHVEGETYKGGSKTKTEKKSDLKSEPKTI